MTRRRNTYTETRPPEKRCPECHGRGSVPSGEGFDEPCRECGGGGYIYDEEDDGSVTYALFKHMADEHGLTLLESEITEIVRLVNATLDERLRWWIANAEGIAQERGELFRAGEAMRAVMVGHAWDGEEVGAWDASAQPMRDMIAALSQNT